MVSTSDRITSPDHTNPRRRPTPEAYKQAYILELQTGKVLLDRESSTPSPPVSLSKLITIYMVFEQLKLGELSLDDKSVVSRKVWKILIGGSWSTASLARHIQRFGLLDQG